jgi:hypothetical protein
MFLVPSSSFFVLGRWTLDVGRWFLRTICKSRAYRLTNKLRPPPKGPTFAPTLCTPLFLMAGEDKNALVWIICEVKQSNTMVG